MALVNPVRCQQGSGRRILTRCSAELVASPEGDIFVDRTKVDVSGADEDADSFNLLYRHAPTFAVGHGCGATWNEARWAGIRRADDVRA